MLIQALCFIFEKDFIVFLLAELFLTLCYKNTTAILQEDGKVELAMLNKISTNSEMLMLNFICRLRKFVR